MPGSELSTSSQVPLLPIKQFPASAMLYVQLLHDTVSSVLAATVAT